MLNTKQITGQALPDDLITSLRDATAIAVLCGAGLSAESGIPTFRDSQAGLWSKHDPMDLASPEGFARNPQLVWQWYQWRRSLIAETAPNAGHLALAELQSKRPSTSIITQNVDGLQQRAGSISEHVLELHGNIERNICSRTRKPIDPAWLRDRCDQPPASPHHPEGLARPDVVWFGESLESATLNQSINVSQNCDLMLVVGTSGLVHPAASLPVLAQDHGARLLEINPQSTALSALVDWHWLQTAAIALPALIDSLFPPKSNNAVKT